VRGGASSDHATSRHRRMRSKRVVGGTLDFKEGKLRKSWGKGIKKNQEGVTLQLGKVVDGGLKLKKDLWGDIRLGFKQGGPPWKKERWAHTEKYDLGCLKGREYGLGSTQRGKGKEDNGRGETGCQSTSKGLRKIEWQLKTVSSWRSLSCLFCADEKGRALGPGIRSSLQALAATSPGNTLKIAQCRLWNRTKEKGEEVRSEPWEFGGRVNPCFDAFRKPLFACWRRAGLTYQKGEAPKQEKKKRREEKKWSRNDAFNLWGGDRRLELSGVSRGEESCGQGVSSWGECERELEGRLENANYTEEKRLMGKAGRTQIGSHKNKG